MQSTQAQLSETSTKLSAANEQITQLNSRIQEITQKGQKEIKEKLDKVQEGHKLQMQELETRYE